MTPRVGVWSSWSTAASSSALQIQTEYYEKAAAYADRKGIRIGVVAQVLDLWERTLAAVETGDLGGCGSGDRLGGEVPAHRAVPQLSTTSRWARRGLPSSTWRTTTFVATAGCTTSWSARG